MEELLARSLRGDIRVDMDFRPDLWLVNVDPTQLELAVLNLAVGEAISGPRPTAVLADEIHEFKSEAPIETWARAIAKMPGDAMMILGTNTPASTQLVGTHYSEFFQKIVKGEADDDEASAYIARVDKADRETVFDNEDRWIKA
jgi:phage terminase large subunit-like protein